MELFVVRHAIAEPRGARVDDADRALTVKGRERFERGVRGLARLGLGLDVVLHSPWRRAVETAATLRSGLGGELVETALLAREPGAELLERVLAEGERHGESVAVVGHEPWLSSLVAVLCGGDVEMKKGAVARLEGEPEPGAMTLRALLPPKVLRALGAR